MINEILEDNQQIVFLSPWSIYTKLYFQGFEKWNQYPCQNSHLLQPREEQSSLSLEDSAKMPNSSWGNSDRQFSSRLSLNRLTDWSAKSAMATLDTGRRSWSSPSPGGRRQPKEPIRGADCPWVLGLVSALVKAGTAGLLKPFFIMGTLVIWLQSLNLAFEEQGKII